MGFAAAASRKLRCVNSGVSTPVCQLRCVSTCRDFEAGPSYYPPPSPPPVATTARPRRKNATRVLTPSPSPPPAADDDDEEEDQEHHGGGEDQEEEGGGEDQEEEGDEEDLSEDEGLGNLVFDPDQSLDWVAPADYQYVPAVERLRPRDRKPYRCGITQLPALKDWRYRHVVLEPYGRSSFKYEDPSQRPPRGYSNILGGLLRWYFPGIVNFPTGGCDVAWRWAHYSLAEDPMGRGTAADLVVAKFWKYFKRAEGKENACDDVLHQLARKRVTGMHYEARVQCVRDWHADRFVHMTKEDARDTLMQPWQYMQNPPQYVGNDERCFLAMVMWWTCPQYLKKHEEGKKKRAEMRGGSHIQGNIPLSLHLQNEEVRTGAKPNVFAVLKKMKQRKTPDPETGSVWVNPQSETQCTSYVSKFKQKYGEDANPEAEDFDPEVAVLAGEGLKHGCLWFGDGCVDPAKVPSLRQIRRGRKSGQPEVEPRPRASDLVVERLREEMAAKEQAAQEQRAQMEQQILEYQQQQTQMMQQMQQQQMMQQQQAQMSWLMSQTVLSSPPGSLPAPPPYSMPWMPPPPTQTPGTPVTVNNMNIIRSMNRGPFAVRVHTAKDFWSLCRVHPHGKGATWPQPVVLGSCWACLEGPLPCVLVCWRTAKPTARHRAAARQRRLARQRRARTAKAMRTTKRMPHGSPGRARQRPLPCKNVDAHGKGAVDVGFVAVHALPNPSNEIFSESDEIKTQIPIFPEPSRTHENRQRGATGPPDDTLARPEGGRAALWCGPLSALLRRLFAYIKPPSRKPYGDDETHRNLPEPPSSRSQDLGDMSLCSGTLPERGSAPEGFSIDTAAISTAIFITAAVP
ncbi:hypothetical protein QYE76_062760 [Lolium multiflorum]|uniref:Uncharacterized protein n=1 Tax=Lolium multiflorum TaxID=4521 RepID=A0AAD8S5T5_LOLMU|nr:hypothetical protein QYE76_062760 [Lolium multiflorum]